jgi:uncharacterized RDD family membrane protein YckC
MTDLSRVVAAVEVAYKVLAARMMALLAMAMTFALYAWAMYANSPLHFAIAGAFGVTIFLPVLWGTRAQAQTGEQT